LSILYLECLEHIKMVRGPKLLSMQSMMTAWHSIILVCVKLRKLLLLWLVEKAMPQPQGH